MNIVIDIDKIKNYNVFYDDKIENTVIDNSFFMRINYSNNIFILNGIFLKVDLMIKHTEKYFNKFKYMYDYYPNSNIINKLINLEKNLLNNSLFNNLIKSYKLSDQLNNLNIRTFDNNNQKVGSNIHEFILKISGIWLTETHCGLTFKFMAYKPIS